MCDLAALAAWDARLVAGSVEDVMERERQRYFRPCSSGGGNKALTLLHLSLSYQHLPLPSNDVTWPTVHPTEQQPTTTARTVDVAPTSSRTAETHALDPHAASIDQLTSVASHDQYTIPPV